MRIFYPNADSCNLRDSMPPANASRNKLCSVLFLR